jgi:hypothetical protein
LIYLPAIVIAAYFDGLWTGLLVTFVAAIAANARSPNRLQRTW